MVECYQQPGGVSHPRPIITPHGPVCVWRACTVHGPGSRCVSLRQAEQGLDTHSHVAQSVCRPLTALPLTCALDSRTKSKWLSVPVQCLRKEHEYCASNPSFRGFKACEMPPLCWCSIAWVIEGQYFSENIGCQKQQKDYMANKSKLQTLSLSDFIHFVYWWNPHRYLLWESCNTDYIGRGFMALGGCYGAHWLGSMWDLYRINLGQEIK